MAAGIEAAQPLNVVAERLGLDRTELVVGDERYDLDTYSDVIFIGGGNAAATAASALEDVLIDQIDRGVVVTDNPVETERIEFLPGDYSVLSERSVGIARTQCWQPPSRPESTTSSSESSPAAEVRSTCPSRRH
ncbi:hypothetical protein GCM10009000_063840 [Halobacterium noricense]|uniref:MOFRL-associated domain-containing protein n=1 Tax=Haladaptatus pallidirubidus TaxID=1008152 RepID=A0AAV3UJX6_9EURY